MARLLARLPGRWRRYAAGDGLATRNQSAERPPLSPLLPAPTASQADASAGRSVMDFQPSSFVGARQGYEFKTAEQVRTAL